MKISHGDALALEHLVRSVYQVDRSAFGGLIDADVFESSPFLAVVIGLAPIFQNGREDEIDAFINKSTEIFLESGGEEKYNSRTFYIEFSDLVQKLKPKSDM